MKKDDQRAGEGIDIGGEKTLKVFFDGWSRGITWLGTLVEMNYGHPFFQVV